MGLHANIYRSHYSDASNGGISSEHEQVTVVNCDGPFEPCDKYPPVMLVKGHHEFSIKIVPVDQKHLENTGEFIPTKSWYMFGGTFVSTSDSRFSDKVSEIIGQRVYSQCVPFHDRTETTEQSSSFD
tara:strand:- start:50 stop:430 length:381 start_codon:yes stop_codon:yes gene_type:complete